MQITMDDIFEFYISENVYVEYRNQDDTWKLVICPEDEQDIVYLLEDKNTKFPEDGFSVDYKDAEINLTFLDFNNYKSIVCEELKKEFE